MNDTATTTADIQPPSSTDTGYFTDADDLTKFIDDSRSRDTKQKSTFADAKAVVDAFAAKTDAGAWASLTRAEVARRLGELVTPPEDGDIWNSQTGPRSLHQGGMNLCGPTALFQTALGRDPVAVMQFATTLFDTGSGTIGRLTITPDQDLLAADYGALSQTGDTSSQAEWMLLGALRNATNVFWQGSWQGDTDQMLAALTRPEEIADWMGKSGIWSSVEDHGKWASNPGIPNAMNLHPYEGTDIALLIHANLIAKSQVLNTPDKKAPDKPDDSFLLNQFPNHWVVLLNDVAMDIPQNNVQFTIWTWGMKLMLNAPKQVFLDNYYGAVIAKL